MVAARQEMDSFNNHLCFYPSMHVLYNAATLQLHVAQGLGFEDYKVSTECEFSMAIPHWHLLVLDRVSEVGILNTNLYRYIQL